MRFFIFSHRSLNRLKDLVAEHLDHLHYLNDILGLEIDALNAVLTDHLLNRLFIPLYIYSIGKGNTVAAAAASASTASTAQLQVR
jgi:protein CLEC16A